MNIHEKYMLRCIELARQGFGNTYPNPMVGSVIVHNNNIIGEGFHIKAGKPHAEVNAINSVADKSLLQESTIYVSLEPCAHFGKTPPCADLITKHKIPKVVIGCRDPFSKVNGKGIEKLEKSGCNVNVGILEKECLELNKRFFTFHNKKRPYIILKWAQSIDGFIGKENEQIWITNSESKKLSHKWRTEEQAILVGTNTTKTDNPSLTAREWYGNNPTRVIIDRNLSLSKHSNVFDNSSPTIVFNTLENGMKGNIELIKLDFENANFHIMNELYKRNIQSIIIEGGAKTINTFIEKGLWDEARVFIGDKILQNGIKAPSFPNEKYISKTINNDKLLVFHNH